METYFTELDPENTLRVGRSKLGMILRRAGYCPSESFISAFKEDSFTLDDVNSIAASIPKALSLDDAFGVFDRKRSGKITIETLNRILLTIGEPLPEIEAQEILTLARRVCLTETGEIQISSLIVEISKLKTV